MTYYCRFFVSEARKRGFSTFVWDNNSFGSGAEHFGIFDRHKGMKVKADWTLKGIMEVLLGVIQDIASWLLKGAEAIVNS